MSLRFDLDGNGELGPPIAPGRPRFSPSSTR